MRGESKSRSHPSYDTKGHWVRANHTLTAAITVWAPPNRLGRPNNLELTKVTGNQQEEKMIMKK
jgi:hypothetical protein